MTNAGHSTTIPHTSSRKKPRCLLACAVCGGTGRVAVSMVSSAALSRLSYSKMRRAACPPPPTQLTVGQSPTTFYPLSTAIHIPHTISPLHSLHSVFPSTAERR